MDFVTKSFQKDETLIAEYNSNHAQKWGQICCKSVQLIRVSSFRNYFSRALSLLKSLFWAKKNKVDSLVERDIVVSEKMALYRKLLWSPRYRIAEMNLNLYLEYL